MWANYVLELLKDAFAFKIKAKELDIPLAAYNPFRKQFSAQLLLDYVVERYKDGLVFAIIDEDIYDSNYNFVFGLAYPFRGAIVSTYRLKNFERIKKEVLHEMGHVFGLGHCNNYCVMRFSNSVFEVDEKPDKYCENCYREILNNGFYVNPKYVIFKENYN